MIRTVLYFLAGALVCWLPLAGLCYLKWKPDGLMCAAVTGPICLIPTTLSLILNIWSQNRSPSEQLMAVLGGMGLRMGTVLLVAVAVFLGVPHESGDGLMFKRPEREFAYWGSLLVFYLFTLGWETYLVSREQRDSSKKTMASNLGEPTA